MKKIRILFCRKALEGFLYPFNKFLLFGLFLFFGPLYFQDLAYSYYLFGEGENDEHVRHHPEVTISMQSAQSFDLNLTHNRSFLNQIDQKDRESIEADVSTRTIAITSGYEGAEVLVFGAIENSKQLSAGSGYYDVVVIVEGNANPVTVRKKDQFGRVWVNRHVLKFNSVPNFYALASTRPIEEIMDKKTRDELGVGFHTIVMAASSSKVPLSSQELSDYKNAVIRLKQDQGLFKKKDKGVVFTGRSLFRTSVHLPASVPVGLLKTRLFLFHSGELLSTYQAEVMLEREGLERWIYAFANDHPFSYGFFTVLVGLLTGLTGSALFHRRIT